MQALRIFLLISTFIIYAITINTTLNQGINWPLVYFSDLLNFDWRSQFNSDFLIHLFLLATWISWREGFTLKGNIYGLLSIIMGGMFGFPYILAVIYKTKGDAKRILLGIHYQTHDN